MREGNIIAFWIVFGFFTGLIAGVVAASDPLEILNIVFFSTLFFYMLAHLSVSLFVRFMTPGQPSFEVRTYESSLDNFYEQIQIRELNFEKICSKEEAADQYKNGESGGER